MVDQTNNATLQPFFDNITYRNITATGSSQNVAIIYGLNSIPASPTDPLRNIDGISFHNVSLSGSYGADIYYTSNLNLSGLAVTATNGNAINLFGDAFVVLGDYNGDGTVDGQDYDIWRANFGSQTFLAADGNGNGIVDAGDYVVWREHVGALLGSGSVANSPAAAAVPEPSAVVTFLAGITTMCCCQRARASKSRLFCRTPVTGYMKANPAWTQDVSSR